jgi:hypothetical protein
MKTLYCPEIVDEICANIVMGNSFKDACILSDISHDTFYTWIKKYPDFSDRVKKSESECKKRNIGIIQKAAINTWQAAAWYLERRYRDEYALKTEVEHKGEVQRKIVFILPEQLKLSPEKIKDLQENFSDKIEMRVTSGIPDTNNERTETES